MNHVNASSLVFCSAKLIALLQSLLLKRGANISSRRSSNTKDREHIYLIIIMLQVIFASFSF